MENNNQLQFCFCDFFNSEHRQNLVELIHHYMNDPMGNVQPSTHHAKDLIGGLSSTPSAFVLYIKKNLIYIGLATCFINFSTFYAKPYINIHDVIIRKEYRGYGYGKLLLQKIIDLAQERGYCKVTLEVREDNIIAQKLYRQLGFSPTNPPMLFWTKFLK